MSNPNVATQQPYVVFFPSQSFTCNGSIPSMIEKDTSVEVGLFRRRGWCYQAFSYLAKWSIKLNSHSSLSPSGVFLPSPPPEPTSLHRKYIDVLHNPMS